MRVECPQVAKRRALMRYIQVTVTDNQLPRKENPIGDSNAFLVVPVRATHRADDYQVCHPHAAFRAPRARNAQPFPSRLRDAFTEMEPTSTVDKLRQEVASASASSSESPAGLGSDGAIHQMSTLDLNNRSETRKWVVALFVDELALKLRESLHDLDEWSTLRGACNVLEAMDTFVSQKLNPLGKQELPAYEKNVQLGWMTQRASLLSEAAEAWPRGISALTTRQGSLLDASGVINSKVSLFQTPPGDFDEAEVQGLSALLWLQPAILGVDLEASRLLPTMVKNLAPLLPARITLLSLEDTDFANGGKDLTGLEAVCDFLWSPFEQCGLRTLNLARNGLLSNAGLMLSEAIRKNQTLTSLDVSGNAIKGAEAKELALAVLHCKELENFGGIPIKHLREDTITGSLDIKTKQRLVQAAEGRVLGALLLSTTQVSSVVLDGGDVPIGWYNNAPGVRDGSPSTVQDELAELNLSKAALGVASAAIISRLLTPDLKLMKLDLSHNKLGAEGCSLLAEGLQEASISVLNLSWNRIGADGLVAVADALAESTSLTCLDLGGNELCGINSFGQGKFNAAGMRRLGGMLPGCALRSLDLSDNCLAGLNGRSMGKLCNDSIICLAEGLSGSKITSLILDANQLGNKATHTLGAALEEHTCLQSLSLADCHCTDNGTDLTGFSQLVNAVRRQPQLVLLNLDGNELGPAGAFLLNPWLKDCPACFESLHIERSSNQLDDEAESLLRSAAGGDIMIHLERCRPSYEAQLRQSDNLKADLERIHSVGADILSVAATPAAADAMSTPSPPSARKQTSGGKAKFRASRLSASGTTT